MRINFAQFPIYDGIKKEKLIASNITEAFGDWIYKNVAGLKAHLLAEKIFKSTVDGVELDEEEVDIIRRSTLCCRLAADSLNDYLDKRRRNNMKIENLERASRINDELAKLKLAKETLNNGGYVRIYSSARSSAGCVELDIANFNGEVSTCIDNHIAELESEIETL